LGEQRFPERLVRSGSVFSKLPFVTSVVIRVKKARLFPLSLTFLTILAGCAGITHRPIADEAADQRVTGLRYYDTSPYLFIHTDNQGGLTSDFVYLPDSTKKRSAKPFAFLAKNKTVLTWDDEGTALLGSSSDVDTGEVPKAIVGALEEVGKTFVKSMFDAPNQKTADSPPRAPRAYIFKVVKRNGVWGLIGASTKEPLYLAN
jgi:hypothetical protein